MSESLLSRPASALRQDQSPPQQESHLQGGISLLSGIATAAYAATFSQPNQLPPILQPRAEAQPALSSYAPERHPEHPFDAHYYNLPPLNAHPTPQLPPKSIHHSIQPDETPYQQQEAHSNQSEQQSIKPTFAQDWWTNPHTAAWAGRMNWPTHFGASHFLQSRGCPPIVIDSRAPSEASSEESLGSLPEEPPEHHVPLRGVAPIPAQHFRPVYPHSAPLHHPYYLNWFPQLPSPASSSHSLILYGQQESPVWSGFQNFTLSDHSRPSSVNADRLSPDPSPVTSLSRVGPPCSRESFTNKTGLTPVDRQTHSMDSTHDLLAAASAEDLSQSDTEAGPIRRGRNRARASQVLALDEAPPADLTSKTTKATQQAAIARRKPGSEARFECPYCHSTFTRSYNLKGHIRAHKGERPFACTFDGCAKAFARHHDLKRHMELHAPGNRRSHCASCSKSFKRPEALLRHYQMEPDHHEGASNSSDEVPSMFPRNLTSTARPARRSVRSAKTSVSDVGGEEDDYLE